MFENSKETSHDGISAAANPLLNPVCVISLTIPSYADYLCSQ
jgi:hypothetical protein